VCYYLHSTSKTIFRSIISFPGTIAKRLSSIGVENTEDNRRKYRQTLLCSPDALAENISGVILYEETFRQNADCGTRFVDILRKKGIIPGIKLDLGVVPLAGTLSEGTTQGNQNICIVIIIFQDSTNLPNAQPNSKKVVVILPNGVVC
jgi:hypothetical protein